MNVNCDAWISETRDGLGVYVVCELPKGHDTTLPHRSSYIPVGMLDRKQITWFTNHDKK